MKNSRFITYCGISTAIICVLAQVAFPIGGVNMTLQTFAISLCAYMFGWKIALASTGTYVLLGTVGLPVFSGFAGGFGVLAGISGGFLLGFLPMAFLLGLGKRKLFVFLFSVAGLCICYLAGCTQFMLVSGRTFYEALALACLPYVVKDVISLVIAYVFAQKINKYINNFE